MTDQFMPEEYLRKVWDGKCGHSKPRMFVAGTGVSLTCGECEAQICLVMRFGRRITFQVCLVKDSSMTEIGIATAESVAKFASGFYGALATYRDGINPGSQTPRYDRTVFGKVMRAIGFDRNMDVKPTDFGVAWNSTDCSHENVRCIIHGDNMQFACGDCGMWVSFFPHDDKFYVRVSNGVHQTHHGLHGSGAVMEFVRGKVDELYFPTDMADKMSDDPERDARDITGLVDALERCGALRRVEFDRPAKHEKFAMRLSAMAVDRKRFTKASRGVAAAMLSDDVEMTINGRAVPTQEALESMRLSWPCGFEAVGMKLVHYIPHGITGFCIDCGFSTLDDDKAKHDAWERGCPECGYVGYLIGL